MILKIFIKLAQQRTCHDELGVDDHKTGIFKKNNKKPRYASFTQPLVALQQKTQEAHACSSKLAE